VRRNVVVVELEEIEEEEGGREGGI